MPNTRLPGQVIRSGSIPSTAITSNFTASFATTASAATSITFTPSTASFASTASNLNGGTTNYIPLWSSATAQSSSNLFQSSSNLGINITNPSSSLHVNGILTTRNVVENIIISSSGPPATFTVDLSSGSLQYRSGSTTAHWTTNFRWNTTTTLNSVLFNGQSVTVGIIVNHGATPYSASTHQVDGRTFTPRWQGRTLPSASANSTDMYTYTIVKLASASYDIFASQATFG